MASDCIATINVGSSVTTVAVDGTPVVVETGTAPIVLLFTQSPVVVEVPITSTIVLQVGVQGPAGAPGADGSTAPSIRDAACPSTCAVDDWVFVTGDEVAGVIQVDTVDIDDTAKMPAIGIVIEKPTFTTARVQVGGELGTFAGLAPGKPHFVGDDSEISTTRPANPSSGKRSIQVIGFALSSTKLIVKPEFSITRILPS